MCVCVLVCIYMSVLGGKGKLTEPLWQVVHSSNTNSVKFLSCHRNKDGDSPLRFSQTTQYFTHGSEFSHIWDFIGQKQCHKQYLTILTFNIFTYALMLWCVCVCVTCNMIFLLRNVLSMVYKLQFNCFINVHSICVRKQLDYNQ